jgi:hypothetical protein
MIRSARSPFVTQYPEPQPLLETGHERRATFRLHRHKQLVGQRVARQSVASARTHPAPPALRRQQLLGRLAQPLAVLGAPALALLGSDLPAVSHDVLLVRPARCGRNPTERWQPDRSGSAASKLRRLLSSCRYAISLTEQPTAIRLLLEAVAD